MKKALLLSAALSGGILATAQSNWTTLYRNNDQHLHFINSILQVQSGFNAGQKPTTQQQRVLAQAFGESSESDSLVYKYSGTRSSRYNHNALGFNYNATLTGLYAPLLVSPYQENPLELQADSIRHYYGTALQEEHRGFYRNDNKLDSIRSVSYDPSSPNYEKVLHSFYPGGYIKEITSLYSFDDINYIENSVRKLTYNTGYTQITSDTLWADLGAGLQPGMTQTYHYNSQNKPDTIRTYYYVSGSGFDLYQATAILYTGSGNLQRVSNYYVVLDTLRLAEVDTFGYTGSNPNFTFYEFRGLDFDGTLNQGTRIIKYMGGDNLPDSAVLFDYGGSSWDEDVRLKYTYNSYSNPDSISATDATGPQGSIRFYYELYDDGVGIDPLVKNKNFSLYPNPFRNELYIDWKGKQSEVNVSLHNVIGQEVYHSTLSLHNGKNTLNIPGLNTGNYILLLRDADGKTWSSKLVKQ